MKDENHQGHLPAFYEGEVEILATVKRAEGDVGPLEVKVNFMTCNDKLGKCLPAESVVVLTKRNECSVFSVQCSVFSVRVRMAEQLPLALWGIR